ncbi:MAG TPA: hypothetical protein VGK19_10120 [Capsulimonadaceae bacterium]
MFKDIIGQEQAIAVLKNAVTSERLPGTYLFTGPASVGKSTAARAMAQALNCTGERDDLSDGCGACYSCKAIAEGTQPDVRSAAPSGPSRMLRIPQFWPRDGVKDHPADRAMLRDLHYAPVRSKKRVFIIEETEAFNDDTANSLLKVLEEPPPYALFILTATSEGSVLPTIASRSQTVRFRRIDIPTIESIIAQKPGVDADHARFFASYSEGQIGVALRMVETPGLIAVRETILDIASDLTGGAPQIQAFKIADELRKAADKSLGKKDETSEGPRTALTRAIDMLLLWYGDLLRIRVAPESASLVNRDRSSQMHMHAPHFEAESLRQAARILLDTRRYIERNANAQVALEAAAMQLLSLPRAR